MLRLIKIFNSNSKGYWYIPENKAPGMVEIDEKTGEVVVAIESTYDTELGYPYFANKARGVVKQMWDSGELPDEKFLAWG
ncbi:MULTISPECIES: hypothetical protein [unclassified Streptococcus]|uniref:hypothetical protein n=1 Tax=unclassified Streptococcus TaxID=2608887 RepID=UPI0011B426E8|nr:MULTISPECIES: hypothetical protein [unclassified Streptococcus]TWS95314.1 hypothetical protein FRX52_00485 [Streptococcus sp. sy018]TWT16448.1 hypothetical protein FRX51_00605 [Streptococcus sp. sy010]